MNKSQSYIEQIVIKYKFLAKHIMPYKKIELVCYVGERFIPDVVLFTTFCEDGVEILCQDGTKTETRVLTTISNLTCDIIISDREPDAPEEKPRVIGFKAMWDENQNL